MKYYKSECFAIGKYISLAYVSICKHYGFITTMIEKVTQ